MSARGLVRSGLRLAGMTSAIAGAGYATYVAFTWARYGHVTPPTLSQRDDLLDRFMPAYEVAERHQIRVSAPAAITLAAAQDNDLARSPMIRAIFKARETILGAAADNRPQPRGLLRQVQALGWVVLVEAPGREIVVGAVTKPWEPNVTFRGIPPEDFTEFNEPDYVKIVWTLRADPISERHSLFRTETRATTTDAAARTKFRRYWACFSPGIVLIRWLSLGPLKREAERRARSWA
jgi:hypothetical protein